MELGKYVVEVGHIQDDLLNILEVLNDNDFLGLNFIENEILVASLSQVEKQKKSFKTWANSGAFIKGTIGYIMVYKATTFNSLEELESVVSKFDNDIEYMKGELVSLELFKVEGK
jgi:hypothetical protein